MKKRLMTIGFGTLFIFSQYCGSDSPSEPDDDIDYSDITDISFSQHVQVILDEYKEILRQPTFFGKVCKWIHGKFDQGLGARRSHYPI
ncbi:hypothetical protein GWO43_15720 [candidate division KSB1 bacterium]|nr:hypothetical protein [candidate division KSB1 bacterium]NIS25403.1 hypothetical protein [candidate division KSB1 bacterium]NIT72291.1 hypothetical protein [candidate division KSB1 bacterium]NIU25698.1 hypothetical protein [candidate division KSB1 bacterium]NIU93448.1 hypothetical protein [candidate division KSB1 bacterium]